MNNSAPQYNGCLFFQALLFVVQEKDIIDMLANNNVSTRAFVVQIFGPTFFYVCPECKNKNLKQEKRELLKNWNNFSNLRLNNQLFNNIINEYKKTKFFKRQNSTCEIRIQMEFWTSKTTCLLRSIYLWFITSGINILTKSWLLWRNQK